MTEPNKSSSAAWLRWLLLGMILVSQLTVLAISPEEKTLGAGIKPVYLHVSLTWTGLVLLAATVLVAVLVVLTGNKKLTIWLTRIMNSGFIFYGVGFLVSMYASMVNWGGVPFGELAVKNTFGFFVVGVFLWAASCWSDHPRVKGALGGLAAGMLLLATRSSQSILHPESPVNSSPLSIKGTFYVMFGLGLLLAIWSLIFQRDVAKSAVPPRQ